MPKTPAAPVRRSHGLDLTPDEIAMRREQSRKRALMSEDMVRCTPDGVPPKRQKMDSSPAFAAVPPSLTLGSSGSVFALAKANVSEVRILMLVGFIILHAFLNVIPLVLPYMQLSTQLDQLAFCFEEGSRLHVEELGEVKKANVELAERIRSLEDDVASAKKREEELSGKLSGAASRRSKDKEEIASLKDKLLDAETLTDVKIAEAVSEVKDEAARSSASRARQVAKLLDRIGGTARDDMLDLAEIDAGLEFIGRLRQPDGPTLDAAEALLRERQGPIYDARDVFSELVADVRQALGIADDDVV